MARKAEQQNMRHWQQGVSLLRNRKLRWEKRLRQLEQMRAAKQRKRLANPTPESEPKFERWYPFEFGVRDKRSGETHFVDLRSVRHASKALSLILKFYQPGTGGVSGGHGIPRRSAASFL